MTTTQVSNLTGATIRQLQWWAEHAYIPVRVDGHQRVWDRAAVEAAMLIVDLRKRGCRPIQCFVAARVQPRFAEARWIVSSGNKCVFCAHEAEALARLERLTAPCVVVRIRRAPEQLPEEPARLVRRRPARRSSEPGVRPNPKLFVAAAVSSERERSMTSRAVRAMSPSQLYNEMRLARMLETARAMQDVDALYRRGRELVEAKPGPPVDARVKARN